jgi:hypothetical protein
MVKVVSTIGQHSTIRDALSATGVDQARWPAFISALSSLTTSEIIRVR